MTLPALLRTARLALTVLLTAALAGAAIGGAWYDVGRTTAAQQLEAARRTDALVTSLAAGYAEQINRQTMALDQTLATMVRDYEADPRGFNLEAARAGATILTGISRDMFLADENGIIRQSSVPDFIGQSVGDLDVFHDAAQHTDDKQTLYLGSAAVNPIMRQWHLDAARTLHHPDGSFAGIIDADYRVSAITDVFSASAPPGDGFAAVIGMTDGKLRATFGSAGGTPDANISDTKMFAVLDTDDSGLWIGPSATDTVVRVHAFRHIPGRDLAVVVGINQQEAMQPVTTWQRQARIFAATITGLATIMLLLVLGMVVGSWRRGRKAADGRAELAASHALAEVSRAQAHAIERRLHAAMAAVTDGLAIFDAHLNLVEWNGLFPERAGVNASLIRTGMPMEDVLRSQARAGYFGEVADVEAEVDRRATLLRAGNFGASLSLQAADRMIELRCRPLEEGGFVALYTDVSEARRSRQALRDARDWLQRERGVRVRFLQVISYELNARVALLKRAVARLRASGVPEETLALVPRVGDSLTGLAADIVEVPRMEANAVVPQPALIAVRPLLREIVETAQAVALDSGITLYQVVNDTAPAELIADPNRIRQIVTVLLSEALRFATPDTMWLMADGGEDDAEGEVALRIIVRGFGTPISDPMRATMFPALDALSAPDRAEDGDAAKATRGIPAGDRAQGTGLGPAIARHLTKLMGGQLHCEGWSTLDGRTGNDFILTLPPDLLPGQRGRAPGEAPAVGRSLPRTRILLAGAPTGLRMAAVTMLRRDGHMVDAVATGEEALRHMENSPYDIVFVDAALPDMTAESTIATAREMNGPPRLIPIVVLAARRDETEERSLRDGGADEVLTGSPTLADLTDAIARHVWLSQTSGTRSGSMPGLNEETEEGIPILAADRVEELRTNIQREELLDMAEECISDLFHRLPALRRSLAVGSLGAISAQAHAMVGMAGGYGMAVLEARLRAILTAVRLRRLDTIDGAAAVVEADLTRAAAALRRTLRMPQPEPSRART